MTLAELLEVAEAESLSAKLIPTDDAAWRYICRSYSEKFHTPLHVVEKELPPEYVIRHHYEGQLDSVDLKDVDQLQKILDSLYGLQDPEYAAQRKQDLEDDIKRFEEEEERRIAEGRPIHKDLKDDNPLGPDLPAKKKPTKKKEEPKPTSGSISLAHFEREDSEGSGFNE